MWAGISCKRKLNLTDVIGGGRGLGNIACGAVERTGGLLKVCGEEEEEEEGKMGMETK